MQNTDVFSKNSMDIGSTETVEHEIPLSDPTPFRIPYRRIPQAEFQEVREHIEDLKKNEIIKPAIAPSLHHSNCTEEGQQHQTLRRLSEVECSYSP